MTRKKALGNGDTDMRICGVLGAVIAIRLALTRRTRSRSMCFVRIAESR